MKVYVVLLVYMFVDVKMVMRKTTAQAPGEIKQNKKDENDLL